MLCTRPFALHPHTPHPIPTHLPLPPLYPHTPSPPFRQYLVECYHLMASSGQSFSTQRASDMLTVLFKKMWAAER